MATPSNNSNAQIMQHIQDSIRELGNKIDALHNMLPNTYVTIRSHEVQIKAHEERIADLHARITALETRLTAALDANIDEHTEIKDNFTKVITDVHTTVTQISERFSLLIKVLAWLLSLITVIVAGVIVAYLTHVLH